VAADPPRLAPFFKRGVVELAGVFQAGVERGLLVPGGPQQELIRERLIAAECSCPSNGL
jgi:hypothetical protein